MSIRVTDASAQTRSLVGLQSAGSRLAALQAQLSSGRQIMTPSDNPSGTAQALALRADIKRNTQYSANATDALSWMSTADTAYTQMIALVQKVRTMAVQALNTGSSTGSSASALADQVDATRTTLINTANATYNGRPVFGGTTTSPVAVDSTGAYVGDSGTVSRAVAPGATVQISQAGDQVFGTAPNDVFSLLSTISSTMRTAPDTLAPMLSQLDGAIATMSAAQASEGAAYQQVQNAQTAQQSVAVSLQSQLSGLQDIDLASMAVQVSTANVTYQAALQTTANIRPMSLLEFLK